MKLYENLCKLKFWNIDHFDFWQHMGTRARIKLFTAIFFIVSVIGFLPELTRQPQWSLPVNYMFAALCGLFAGIIVIASSEKRYTTVFLSVLLFFVAVHLIKMFSVKVILEPEALRNHKEILMFSATVCIVIGYSTFLHLIGSEGQQAVKMKMSLNLANEIHDSLVPDIEFENKYFRAAGKSVSIEDMGGDLIDIVASGNTHTIYIADVSGHGVSAGIVMSMFKGAIRSLINENLNISKVFTKVNATLYPIRKKNMFITAAGLALSSDRETAEMAIAGHLPVLQYSHRHSKFIRHHVRQVPLGATSKTEYESVKASYKSGDYFVLITDGLTEHKENFDNLAMLSHIEFLLSQKLNASLSLKQIIEDLFSDMASLGNPMDDRSVIIIKCL